MTAVYPQLFESVPDALIVVNQSGCIVRANHQADQLFGYPLDGLTGLDIEQLMPESLRDRHRAHRDSYMAVPRIRPMGGGTMALVGQRRDGTQFPIEIALSPLSSEEGGLHFLASVRDISESQRARQALVRARYDALVARIGQQALESTDEESVIIALPSLLAEALGVETVALAFLRESGELEVRAAVGLERLVSTQSDTARAKPLSDQALIIEDFAHAPASFPLGGAAVGSGAMVPLVDRGRPMGALVARAREPRRFDHDALHLLQSVAHLVAALVQRHRTEEQLAHSQRLEALGQLTGGIAHDFNNLLTVMSGSLQLLEMQCGEQPEAAELISSALRSVTRGAELTGKLLAFARRQRLSPRAIEPIRLLRDLEVMLRRTLGDSIQLKIDCPETIPAAFADAAQLDSALLNLALNSRDAMTRGGKITIGASECRVANDAARQELAPGHYIVFTVTDTGTGMTPETLARAVEPFYTTKGSGRGSGLGLSMVYGFIAQSGGHLHIDSRLGYGTRVNLYLPAAREQPMASVSLESGIALGTGQLVLVVEDEHAVRDIAAAFVRSLGYRVHAVGSAAEALRYLATEPGVGILFSDVMLGSGMNGNELANAVRKDRPHLPVLLTSGYENTTMSVADTQQFELLRKPYRREDLATALQRICPGAGSPR